jgi:regulator of protease activity HflC (stomatin/prohibitin superfamily)
MEEILPSFFKQLSLGETIGIAIVAIIIAVIIASSIRIIREYERAVVFRLGRYDTFRNAKKVLLYLQRNLVSAKLFRARLTF